MLLPRINNLEGETGYGRDKVSILTRQEFTEAPPKDVLIALSGEPEKPPAAGRKKKRPVPPIPQEEEMQRFFKAINSTRDRAIFRIMYHAGLRASEIGLREMRDYIPRTDRLMISRLKGSNSGEHHLCCEEARALKAWLKERGPCNRS